MELIIAIFALFFAAASHGATVVDHYALSMTLQVPRIYNNWTARWKRRTQE